MRTLALVLPAAALLGCGLAGGRRDGPPAGLESDVARSERYARESRTLSHLAALEIALKDFIQTEGRPPARLEQLAPKYIAEIPPVELGLSQHRDSSEAEYYLADAVQDGALDGARLKDTGRWGYARTETQVIIFVDCTHASSRNKLWYQERGVF